MSINISTHINYYDPWKQYDCASYVRRKVNSRGVVQQVFSLFRCMRITAEKLFSSVIKPVYPASHISKLHKRYIMLGVRGLLKGLKIEVEKLDSGSRVTVPYCTVRRKKEVSGKREWNRFKCITWRLRWQLRKTPMKRSEEKKQRSEERYIKESEMSWYRRMDLSAILSTVLYCTVQYWTCQDGSTLEEYCEEGELFDLLSSKSGVL